MSDTAPTAAPKRDRATAIIIVIMIGVCVTIVLQRNVVRGWWWARSLTTAESVKERNYYVTMLASLREDAVGPATRLLHDERAEIRSLGTGILVHAKSWRAIEPLIEALCDSDEDVRFGAAHALAFGYEESAPTLIDLIGGQRGDPAIAMCVAIGRMTSDASFDSLMTIAKSHAEANVRAQAVELLGLRRDKRAETLVRTMLNDKTSVSCRLYDEILTGDVALQAMKAAASQGVSSRPTVPSPKTIGDVAAIAIDRILSPPMDELPTASAPA